FYLVSLCWLAIVGSFRPVYWMLSGVLQGCSLSCSVYVLASNCFYLGMLRNIQAKGRGMIFACADEMGAILRDADAFRVARRVFGLAQRLATLALKGAKCVAIPLFAAVSEEVMQEVRVFLDRCGWSSFTVAAQATYLGCEMGPAVTEDEQWRAPCAKLRD
ncbi:unnamed protein product, partial [Prorocentrum cordatum]